MIGTTNSIQKHEYVYIASAELLSSYSNSSLSTTKVNVIGSYGVGLFYSLIKAGEDLYNVTQDDLFFRITGMGTNNNGAHVYLWLNNLWLVDFETYSSNSFRTNFCSRIFKLDEIVLEKTLTYTTTGINLKFQATESTSMAVYSVMAHAYILK